MTRHLLDLFIELIVTAWILLSHTSQSRHLQKAQLIDLIDELRKSWIKRCSVTNFNWSLASYLNHRIASSYIVNFISHDAVTRIRLDLTSRFSLFLSASSFHSLQYQYDFCVFFLFSFSCDCELSCYLDLTTMSWLLISMSLCESKDFMIFR